MPFVKQNHCHFLISWVYKTTCMRSALRHILPWLWWRAEENSQPSWMWFLGHQCVCIWLTHIFRTKKNSFSNSIQHYWRWSQRLINLVTSHMLTSYCGRIIHITGPLWWNYQWLVYSLHQGQVMHAFVICLCWPEQGVHNSRVSRGFMSQSKQRDKISDPQTITTFGDHNKGFSFAQLWRKLLILILW